MLSLATLVALGCLAFSPLGAEAYECTGMGRRYCSNKSPAHVVKSDCPRPCQRKQCQGRRSTELERNGAQRDRRDGGTPTWEEVAFSGLYDHVFVDGNEICLATCWFEPWNSKCYDWDTNFGAKYCKGLDCRHDKGTKFNGGTRYSGCHSDKDSGRRKLPWHKPTCRECARVFPEACFNELRPYYDKDALRKYRAERLAVKKELEMNARKYCYLTYFGDVLGVDVEELTYPSSSEEVDESSGAGKVSLSNKAPFAADLSPRALQTFKNLEIMNRLSCPAPQCLTAHPELLRSLVAPWYHTSDATGICSFDECESDKNQGAQWCKASADNCIRCKGTWCPPKSVPFWTPVNEESFEPLMPFYTEDKLYSRFPRSACNYNPLTRISQENTADLPWFDPAGDIFAIKPRTLDPELLEQLQDTRDEYNKDLIVEHERMEEQKLIEAKLEAQRQARAEKLRKERLQEEKERKAAAAEAARKRMIQEAILKKEQEKATAREMESASRQYCYDRYISEAARYGGVEIGGGLEAIEGESADDSEGSQKFKLEEMEATGKLTCPPAECYFEEVVQEFPDNTQVLEEILPGDLDAKPVDDSDDLDIDWRVRSLLPWYYQTSDGFCSWGGDKCTPSASSGFCDQGTNQCISCGGAWCPPVTGKGWAAVDGSSYIPIVNAVELVTNKPVVVVANGDKNNTDSIQGDEITVFDFRKCTDSSITGLPLWQVKDLYWPGMIDFAAAIAKQRGTQDVSKAALGGPRRSGKGARL